MGEAVLEALTHRNQKTKHGVLVWQHATRRRVPAVVLDRPLWKSRRYSNTQLSLYTVLAERPPALEP
jgi:hypothetical protein